jgi:hypothetical protein
MDHPLARVFWVSLFGCVAEGNGRLVEVDRENWEAISGGNMKTPPSASIGKERRATKKSRACLYRLPLLRDIVVVEGRTPGVPPNLGLNI